MHRNLSPLFLSHPMKVRASVKPICKDCRLVIRRSGRTGKLTRRIVCQNPRHKQRQG